MLRPLPYHWGGLDWSAVYVTADHVARVGGDFYDLQPSRYGTRVILGDVQGKGLGAVAASAVLLGTFREAGYHEGRLRDVARRLETRMKRQQAYTRYLGQDEGASGSRRRWCSPSTRWSRARSGAASPGSRS